MFFPIAQPSNPVWPAVVRRLLRARLLALVAGVIAVLGLTACSSYDELVQKDQVCQQRWADVEAELQRRYDLIPRLVNTVKGATKFEEETLQAVTKARSLKVDQNTLTDPEQMKKFNETQAQLNNALRGLMINVERYPDLKATQAYRDLQSQLEGTENRLLRARQKYNEAVSDYNATLLKVGGKAINRITGQPFKPREYFKADVGSQAAPAVSF